MDQNAQAVKVGDIMTTDVQSAKLDTSVLEVARLLFEHQFTGVPVVDNEGKIQGIITEYDLLSRGDHIHIPTYVEMFSQLKKAGKAEKLKKEMKEIASLTARDLMTADVVSITPDTSITVVAELFVEKHINPIPVVDDENHMVGIVSRSDVVRSVTQL